MCEELGNISSVRPWASWDHPAVLQAPLASRPRVREVAEILDASRRLTQVEEATHAERRANLPTQARSTVQGPYLVRCFAFW